MEEAQKAYDLILSAWNENKSYSTIYHMIVEWVTTYKDILKSKEDVEDILERMNYDDELKEIVADFIYGKTYAAIRAEMTS